MQIFDLSKLEASSHLNQWVTQQTISFSKMVVIFKIPTTCD